MKTKLTIGKLAKQAGVGVETIRFYERKQLMRQPDRKIAGYREYDADDAKRIYFIKRAQDLGFTLKEVKELLGLQTTSRATCGDVKKRADIKIAEVQEKIEDLKKMQRSLKSISACCARGEATQNSCLMLDCFEGNC